MILRCSSFSDRLWGSCFFRNSEMGSLVVYFHVVFVMVSMEQPRAYGSYRASCACAWFGILRTSCHVEDS